MDIELEVVVCGDVPATMSNWEVDDGVYVTGKGSLVVVTGNNHVVVVPGATCGALVGSLTGADLSTPVRKVAKITVEVE